MKLVEADSGPYLQKFTSTEAFCQTRRIMGIVEVKNVVIKKVRVTDTEYLHRFIRAIKKILRGVDQLHDVRIHINAFDPLNEIHEWIVTVAELLKELVPLPINYKSTVFICIRKKHKLLYLGSIQF
jgi:pyruvate-formate lyase-activating enzyme